MKREQSTFARCYSCAMVEETHMSLNKLKRTLTIRYVGPELLRREGTKEDGDWPPQSKKESEEACDNDLVKVRYTVKDSRSIIKMDSIMQKIPLMKAQYYHEASLMKTNMSKKKKE